ncbi:MAG: DUF1611 domain-containing protein [Gammaproteobacteria bacterium]
MPRATAVVAANRRFMTPNGKTAHGLVRGSERFEVRAVIDPDCAGRDAGEVLDGQHRAIPIVASMDEAMALHAEPPAYFIVGVATHGGRFTPEIRALLIDAAGRGLHIANGLHDAASEDPEIAEAARRTGAGIVDLRKAPPKSELHFWEGDIYEVRAPRIAVLGTDCALGKRTTARMLMQALCAAGLDAQMIYTGQTGWMQGARYGFVFDATPNDYVSGELEHAIVTCDREAAPDVMVLEGQSSLRNPSGPCGSEFLLSAAAKGVVLQHAAGREHFEGYEAMGLRLPSLADEIALIQAYGAQTLAVTLNSAAMQGEALEDYRRACEAELGIPVVSVLEQGLERLVPVVRDFVARQTSWASTA